MHMLSHASEIQTMVRIGKMTDDVSKAYDNVIWPAKGVMHSCKLSNCVFS